MRLMATFCGCSRSSPSAPEYNITTQFTQGVGDASGPEVSYDGKKILFASSHLDPNLDKTEDDERKPEIARKENGNEQGQN